MVHKNYTILKGKYDAGDRKESILYNTVYNTVKDIIINEFLMSLHFFIFGECF